LVNVRGKASSSHTFKLSVDPLYVRLNLERLKTIIYDKDIPLVFKLVPSDRVDLIVSSILNESQKKEWIDICAEDFVNLTDAGKTVEGAVFGATSTRYDNWNHREIYLHGLSLIKNLYPPASLPDGFGGNSNNNTTNTNSVTHNLIQLDMDEKQTNTETNLKETHSSDSEIK